MNGMLINICGAPILCQVPLWGVSDFVDRLSKLLEATQLAKGTAGITGGASLLYRGCENIHSVLILVEETVVEFRGNSGDGRWRKHWRNLVRSKLHDLANSCLKEHGRSPRELQGFGYG